MPTAAKRILDYLNQHPEGADDDELTVALGLKRRQHTNIVCRNLASRQLIRRQRVDGKIRNFATGQTVPVPTRAPADASGRPWYWEGCVQARVEQYLRAQGYTILRTANTATHERGKDIEAQKDGRPLWVSVKGYPRGTKRTQPGGQAVLWFKDAMFDMLVWHGVKTAADLALAFPDFPRYHKSLAKVAWLQPVIKFDVFWVSESGEVRRESAV
ncbi:MAG: MarR family transcriptional regulator [Chloroflexi bacterium]|nr:MarR family transcriptional regulator [Chloroflexota bacterium]